MYRCFAMSSKQINLLSALTRPFSTMECRQQCKWKQKHGKRELRMPTSCLRSNHEIGQYALREWPLTITSTEEYSSFHSMHVEYWMGVACKVVYCVWQTYVVLYAVTIRKIKFNLKAFLLNYTHQQTFPPYHTPLLTRVLGSRTKAFKLH